MRFVIPVGFYEITNVQCNYRAHIVHNMIPTIDINVASLDIAW